MSEIAQFDIRNFIDQLTPAKGKNRYICPVCAGNNMTVDPKTGKYQCWNGCDCSEIREALAPWAKRQQTYSPQPHSHKLKINKKTPLPAPLPDGRIELATLPNPVEVPARVKKGNTIEIIYFYSATQYVLRVECPDDKKPKGYSKKIIPFHVDSAGKEIKGKGNKAWEPYRMGEVEQYSAGKWVLTVEGEPCVDCSRLYLNLVTFTFQGSEWTDEAIYRALLKIKAANIAGLILLRDNDKTGYAKAKKIELIAAKIQLPLIIIDPLQLWPECPHKGDIVDWVQWGQEQNMDQAEFIRRLEEEIYRAVEVRNQEVAEFEQLEHPQNLTKRDAIEQAKSIIKLGLDELEETIQLDDLREQAGFSVSFWERRILPPLRRNLQSERLKLEIQTFLLQTEVTDQITERSRIVSRYHLTHKEFDQLCHTIRYAEKQNQQKPRLLTPKELFNLESENLDFLIPGYLPRYASALISGLPGAGKSLLTIDLAYALTTAGEFLSEKVKLGKVMIINSDQPLNITASYLSDRGFDQDNPDWKVVGPNRDMVAWTIKDLELLETWLEEFQPDLVIIDSIRTTICYPLGIEEKSEIVGHWMKEVERLVIRYGSLLWVHHDNKDTNLNGVSRASGSTAITGNVSVHWRLERATKDDSDPNRIFSMPKTRGFEPITANLKYESVSGQWIYQGRIGESPEVAKANQTLQQKIIELLEQRLEVGFEGKEIKDLLGGSDSVHTVLSRMVQRGIIGKRKSKTNSAKNAKVYFLSSGVNSEKTVQPPLSPLSVSDVNFQSESLTEQDFPKLNTKPNTCPIKPNTNGVLDLKTQVLDSEKAELAMASPVFEVNLTPEPNTGGEVCESTAQFESVIESGAINLDSVITDADSIKSTQPESVLFNSGDRVKFQHESFSGWRKGKIVEVVREQDYVQYFVVQASVRDTKTGLWEARTYNIYNGKWLRQL
jgi:hypothetical protein